MPLCHGIGGPCFKKGKRQRQNTQYVKDESNYVFLCDECMEINNEHWQERWDEYYSGCI